MIKLLDILAEKKMTPGEKKEKEKIVKGMKKAKGEFKKLYGKDAEQVMYATATKKAMAKEELDPVGKEDADINNDGKVDKTDKYLANRRKAIAANLKEGDHEVAMAVSSLEAIAEAIIELRQKLGNVERNIPGWIQDHIAKAENYIEQAAQGFHELKNEEPIQENVKIRTEPAGFRSVEKIISSRDKAAVEQAIENIEKQYPSAGYGTHVKKMGQMPSGIWVAVVRHSTTSD
jgi:pyruvate/2-oxoglutarate dehydrogenase complex dihydrolipoamide acyltransferase (E2) component